MISLALFIIAFCEFWLCSRRYKEVLGDPFASFEEFISHASLEDIMFVHTHGLRGFLASQMATMTLLMRV